MTKDECAALRAMAEEWARRAEGMRDQAHRARLRARGSTWDQSCEIQAKKLENFRDLCYGLSIKYDPERPLSAVETV